jgi:Transposase DDE domain group 1
VRQGGDRLWTTHDRQSEHRDHAVVEQVIADLKDQALVHFPSGEFNANGAWTVLGALAHNLLRWTQLIGLPDSTVRADRTPRWRLLTIAGRPTRPGRSWTLHLPARWPWQGDYITALARIRALPTARTPPSRLREPRGDTSIIDRRLTADLDSPSSPQRSTSGPPTLRIGGSGLRPATPEHSPDASAIASPRLSSTWLSPACFRSGIRHGWNRSAESSVFPFRTE